jgi:hypothetical protein
MIPLVSDVIISDFVDNPNNLEQRFGFIKYLVEQLKLV